MDGAGGSVTHHVFLRHSQLAGDGGETVGQRTRAVSSAPFTFVILPSIAALTGPCRWASLIPMSSIGGDRITLELQGTFLLWNST